MPGPAFRFLEYVFLALLYLFFLRVVRAVWVELREPRLVSAPYGAPSPLAEAATTTTTTTAAPAGAQTGGKRSGALHLAVVGPGQAKDAVVALADEMSIGRATGCAVSLPEDTFVSQVHARIFHKGDGYWAEDLGSTNGTLLNGRKLTSAVPLRRGDRLQVGQTVLEVRK